MLPRLPREGGQYGANPELLSKCEPLAHPRVTVNDKRLQSFQRVVPSDSTLLGALLFHGPVLDQAWAHRCDNLSRHAHTHPYNGPFPGLPR